MDAESYLHWLSTTELVNARLSDLKQAVDSIVDGLLAECEQDEPSEMLLALQSVQAKLDSGQLPLKSLEIFRDNFLCDADQFEPPEVILERELREIAAGIAKSRWGTETYGNLEKAIDGFLDGGEEDVLWRAVDAIDELIERVAQSYQATAILPKEVTMESIVTHQLLCEGIEEWKSALEMLRDDESEEEPDWSAVLKRAELGNRLLVAVQIYQGRLQSALSA